MSINVAKVSSKGFRLTVDPSLAKVKEAFVITISGDCVVITGKDGAGFCYQINILGVYYGVTVINQLIKRQPQSTHITFPQMKLFDFPDFPERSVMLDISRDKVPTLDTVLLLAERLSEWRINQVFF